jgi:hypothetical protein
LLAADAQPGNAALPVVGNAILPAGGNAVLPATSDPEGPRSITARLRAVQWPVGFKIFKVELYDGQANLEQWLMSYAIAVRGAEGST